tara:strand:- start:428 stop:949 length:522 start_codon:yes stop_codon:yes gene_type:complete
MAEERSGVCTFLGNPLTLIGPELSVGDDAPDFSVIELTEGLDERTLMSSSGVRLFNVVPCLDTPVCDEQTRRFNSELGNLPEGVKVITVSADLPFAQARWCGEADAGGIQFLSDHKETSFGEAYGVLIKELRLLARSIFVVDSNNNIAYREYVGEVTEHPNYDAALEAAKNAS